MRPCWPARYVLFFHDGRRQGRRMTPVAIGRIDGAVPIPCTPLSTTCSATGGRLTPPTITGMHRMSRSFRRSDSRANDNRASLHVASFRTKPNQPIHRRPGGHRPLNHKEFNADHNEPEATLRTASRVLDVHRASGALVAAGATEFNQQVTGSPPMKPTCSAGRAVNAMPDRSSMTSCVITWRLN